MGAIQLHYKEYFLMIFLKNNTLGLIEFLKGIFSNVSKSSHNNFKDIFHREFLRTSSSNINIFHTSPLPHFDIIFCNRGISEINLLKIFLISRIFRDTDLKAMETILPELMYYLFFRTNDRGSSIIFSTKYGIYAAGF